MGWLRLLAGAKWLPYVAIAVVVWTAAVSGYSYLKGYGKAAARAERKMALAIAEERDRLLALAAQDREAVVRQLTRQQSIRDRINDIPIPDTTDCTDPEWLQSYNAAIRATHPPGTQASP